MYGTTLSFANMHNHGALFANILTARREAYHAGRGWNLPETMGIEYDQYDTPVSRWLAVNDAAGNVLAGARLTPTTAQSGIYSYLLRDAQNGLLEGIPGDLLFEQAPVERGIWEVTRGFFTEGLATHMRQDVLDTLVRQTAMAAREEGITKLLALMPADWERWVPRMSPNLKAAGPKTQMGAYLNQAVWIDFGSNLH
jgi:N-acyl-L-homoserine lactone synthetase